MSRKFLQNCKKFLAKSSKFQQKPKKTTSVERVMQRAFAQVIFSARDQINPVDIFVSILSEDKSHAQYYCELNGITR
mgnify:CR=1 FL=1